MRLRGPGRRRPVYRQDRTVRCVGGSGWLLKKMASEAVCRGSAATALTLLSSLGRFCALLHRETAAVNRWRSALDINGPVCNPPFWVERDLSALFYKRWNQKMNGAALRYERLRVGVFRETSSRSTLNELEIWARCDGGQLRSSHFTIRSISTNTEQFFFFKIRGFKQIVATPT